MNQILYKIIHNAKSKMKLQNNFKTKQKNLKFKNQMKNTIYKYQKWKMHYWINHKKLINQKTKISRMNLKSHFYSKMRFKFFSLIKI